VRFHSVSERSVQFSLIPDDHRILRTAVRNYLVDAALGKFKMEIREAVVLTGFLERFTDEPRPLHATPEELGYLATSLVKSRLDSSQVEFAQDMAEEFRARQYGVDLSVSAPDTFEDFMKS